MRQLTLGVQLKERATFASFLTARNVELVAHLRHLAEATPPGATWMNILPWWLTAVAVGRDVMIGFGAVIYRFWFGPLHGRPTLLSKINTGMQLAVALAAILVAATGVPEEMVTALAIVTLITTVISGAGYLGSFTRRALTS